MTKGRDGEDRACRELTAAGYEVVARNVRFRFGEIDVIVRHADEIHFVEVKRWDAYPLDEVGRSVTRRKRERILAASRVFLHRHPELAGLEPRYDLMFIGPQGSEFLEGALTG